MVREWPEIMGSLGGLGVGKRVLGPSLDELGESLRRLTERRLRNVGRVVQKANALSEGQPEEASPNLRAAFSIFQEAMVAEDEVVADYLGGVLASARGEGGDDAVAWTALIARMSSRELRTHYKLYSATRLAGLGHTEINVLDHPGRERLRSFLSHLELVKPHLETELMEIMYVLAGLDREGLFDGGWRFGRSGPRGGKRWPRGGVRSLPHRIRIRSCGAMVSAPWAHATFSKIEHCRQWRVSRYRGPSCCNRLRRTHKSQGEGRAT